VIPALPADGDAMIPACGKVCMGVSGCIKALLWAVRKNPFARRETAAEADQPRSVVSSCPVRNTLGVPDLARLKLKSDVGAVTGGGGECGPADHACLIGCQEDNQRSDVLRFNPWDAKWRFFSVTRRRCAHPAPRHRWVCPRRLGSLARNGPHAGSAQCRPARG
jgi:hypothetical protein